MAGRQGQCHSFCRGLRAVGICPALYNLVSRDVERELLPVCEGAGVGMERWSTLAAGMLSGKYRDHSTPTPSPVSAFKLPSPCHAIGSTTRSR
ncbi:aldo/keto reductase [Devosia psychrophila]|uniref:aldo/keto reductase n=1 Tax=Devosia psychrophila TaxID=728005 RepID=UPI003CC7A865